ncbi:hypothetical protein [Butyrivibrio sp. AD3002]|uniref:hypothetical protein n=1 Tax=Butyrivibrio sp. AD3002 TaxID=1280670 RepID=UPI0003B5C41C|nr:hypothetical protein [Butyrivibrio sp. AD3002]
MDSNEIEYSEDALIFLSLYKQMDKMSQEFFKWLLPEIAEGRLDVIGMGSEGLQKIYEDWKAEHKRNI